MVLLYISLSKTEYTNQPLLILVAYKIVKCDRFYAGPFFEADDEFLICA